MPNFPNLSFLPVEDLLIHERHDDSRTRPLILRIRSSGVLRNPPIVAPLQDGTARYMVLDGANRVTALKGMGYPHILVQVVEPDDPGLQLLNWNHVVWELNPNRFMAGLHRIPEIELIEVKDDVETNLEGDCGLAMIKVCSGEIFSVCTSEVELVPRVRLLHAIVDSYKDRARLDRTSQCDVAGLVDIYPQLCGLVVFPPFKIQVLLRLAGQGCLLPAGITRFMIAPRALHLNYPLEELSKEEPLAEKNNRLQKWLQERLARKGVRYYAEPTYLFDE